MIDQALKSAEEKMGKAIEVSRDDFASVRTGRASSAIVERILVDYYGSPTPLKQLASFSVPEARQLLVSPFDRNAITAIEKAISSSDVGVTPNNDGAVIRLNFPMLTEERRKEMTKVVRDRAEHGRVAIRNIRRHVKDEIDRDMKDGKVSEDDAKRAEKDLQKLTDKYVGEIDQMVQRKEHELMEV